MVDAIIGRFRGAVPSSSRVCMFVGAALNTPIPIIVVARPATSWAFTVAGRRWSHGQGRMALALRLPSCRGPMQTVSFMVAMPSTWRQGSEAEDRAAQSLLIDLPTSAESWKTLEEHAINDGLHTEEY